MVLSIPVAINKVAAVLMDEELTNKLFSIHLGIGLEEHLTRQLIITWLYRST